MLDAAPQDKRGNHADFDIAGELRSQLTRELEENNLLATAGADGYTLTAKITDYRPGSAFKRWLMPGMGSTVLTVEGTLHEADKEVGTINAKRTVGMGGAYSAGAWRTIFAKVADDIVDDIKAKLAVKQ